MDPLLKQRLVGTAILAGLAIIFIPMVLDGPVDRVDAPQSTGVPLALPAEPESRPVPAVVTPTPAPARETRATAATPERRADESARWAVQLGSFSAQDNADALAAKVRARGFEAFVQDVEVATGSMYRVRIGPTADRDSANVLAARVQRETGERAVVVPHP